MKLKLALVVLLAGTTIGNVFAQDTQWALKPGDKVPDITFSIMNGERRPITLSSLKGKLVILDFWSTWCIACIRNFPKMDSLQAKFGDKLKIILINPRFANDDEKKVNRVFELYNKKFNKPIGLSSVFGDSLAEKYFPHRAHPHIVVIDQDGIFKTTTLTISGNDISMLLEGKDPGLLAKSEAIETTRALNIFSVDTTGIMYKSMLTGYLDSISTDFRHNNRQILNSHRTKVLRFINAPLFDILRHLYLFFPPENLVVLEGIDKHSIFVPDNVRPDEWERKYIFNYELIAPNLNREEIQKQAKADIAKYFGIEVKVEKRKIPCWVLKLNEAQYKVLAKKATKIKDPKTLSLMVEIYFGQLDIPVVAETDYDIPLFKDLMQEEYSFGRKYKTETDLQQFAIEHNLALTREEREHKVFVITKVR